MARDYWFSFGGGLPSTYTGLAPTFIYFVNSAGSTIAPPTISETYSGTGLYKANYNATQTIAFVLDGATTGLAANVRYVTGVFDPQDMFGTTLTAIGNSVSVLALGTTLTAIGSSLSVLAVGTTLVAQGSTIVGIGNTVGAMGNTIGAIGVTLIAQGSTIVGIGNTVGAIGNTVGAMGVTLIAQGSTIVGIGNTVAGMGNTVGAIGVTLIAQGSTIVGIGSTVAAIGSTNSAIGSSLAGLYTLVGTTSSLIGTNLSDPTTVFGFLKRAQEYWEGAETYTKATGVMDTYDRTGATLIRQVTIADNQTQTTRINS